LGEHNIFVTTGANFTNIMSYMYLGQDIHQLGFWVKRSQQAKA